MKVKCPNGALLINRLLKDNGYEAYLVGGCVRDSLLGMTPKDFDFCTNARPEQIIKIMHDNKIVVVTVGIEYGTVIALLDGEEFEITTYRFDGGYDDNRHPSEVKYTNNLKFDLARRDFTINALAYDIDSDTIVDEYDGIKDLENGIIRAIGSADQRFREDSLRILRALRFAIRYQFTINKDTLKSMIVNKKLLSNISKERITNEFRNMLTYGQPIKFYFNMCHDIIFEVIPELKDCYLFNQNNKYHSHDVYMHILYVVDYCDTNDFCIKLAALLHDIGKPNSYTEDEFGFGHFYGHPEESYQICLDALKNNFRLTTKEYEEVLELVRYHDISVDSTDKAVKRALNKYGRNFMDKWLILKDADIKDHIFPSCRFKLWVDIPRIKELLTAIDRDDACFTIKNLAVNGNDIINELHIKPGKQVGEILQALLCDVIDNNVINERTELLRLALKYCNVNKEMGNKYE